MKFLLFSLMVIYLGVYCEKDNDFYKLLGVPRDATVKEIRKAFKILAVKLHPDKNKNDEDAAANFIKLAKAYEILKDPDTRKHYDLHGERQEEFENFKKHQSYHSYTYYRDQFGIYDDDPLIITLSRNDYEVNVLDRNQAWFVNFYSPNCHHCHELAPTWRKLAAEMEGVIRIAAVNCEDDYALCTQLSIEAYPTLLYYEKEAHVYQGEKYKGPRTLEALKEYVLDQIVVNITYINVNNWNDLKNQKWLLILCSSEDGNCPEEETIKKLAATMEGLVPVGIVTTEALREEILESYKEGPIVFWQNDERKESKPIINSIKGNNSKDILNQILNILPNPETLNEDRFKEERTKLRSDSSIPWLICFYLGRATDLNLQLKRLPTLIPNINIGLVHCGKSSALCSLLHVARYPTWGVLKVGGAFEIFHGRDILHEVASFARDSVISTNLQALTPADFQNIKNTGSSWFIDWYAPWCPPCKKLTPEIRKASQKFDSKNVQFGTIDCTLHRELCAREGITSYPTMFLYNGTQTVRFYGTPNEEGITEFVQDMTNPIVLSLDENSFVRLLRKTGRELWVVDFYAPWCGPCQRLGPEWRRLAKSLSQFEEIKVAQLDCVAYAEICNAQNIRSYPTIRLYPLGSKGLSTVAIYNGNRNAISLKRWVLSFIPSNVEPLSADEFKEQILTTQYFLPWLVDFYAPWCAHCIHFEPEFRTVAQRLEGRVRSAKIDCEANRIFCGSQRITGYPTLRLYLSPTEFYLIDSQDSLQIIKKVKSIIEEKNKYEHDEL